MFKLDHTSHRIAAFALGLSFLGNLIAFLYQVKIIFNLSAPKYSTFSSPGLHALYKF
jgi:hypothetical protein